MEKLVRYFTHIQSWERSLILAGGIVLFWMLEGILPLVRFRYNKFRHAGLNIFFTLTTVIVNFAFAALIVKTSQYVGDHKIGLLYLFPMPLWLFTLAGLLLLDLIGAWFIHWLEHQVKWMWKFHLIHHSDTWVDTTTANRHHPGESVFRAAFTLLAVLISGAPLWLVFFYQSLSVLTSQFNHANISLPKALDKALSWVIVSPDMHKVHHHHTQPLTDTNYGNIFSIWDRLFGTFVYVKDTRTLNFGIDTYPEEKENNRMGPLLKMPFGEYRPPVGAKFSKR
jgi:sterol desaturase/sphingolipid hydroxylase (fatty acid hydroxylase superfamily)